MFHSSLLSAVAAKAIKYHTRVDACTCNKHTQLVAWTCMVCDKPPCVQLGLGHSLVHPPPPPLRKRKVTARMSIPPPCTRKQKDTARMSIHAPPLIKRKITAWMSTGGPAPPL